MKRVIEKIVALSLLIGIITSFGSQTLLQSISVLTYAKTFDYNAENILDNVFEADGLTILPFIFKDSKETIKKADLIEKFKTVGEEITNAEELKDIIVTGDKIVTSSKTYTVLIYGDVDADGLVTVFDAQMALRHYVGSNNVNLTGVFEMAANVDNEDTIITTFDAQRILRFYVGNVDKLLVNDLEIVVPEKPTLNKIIFGDKESPVTSDTVKVNETIKRQIYFIDENGATLEIPANKVKITSTEDIEVTLLDAEGETIPSTSEESVKKIGIKGLRTADETDLTIAVEGYETKGITVKITVVTNVIPEDKITKIVTSMENVEGTNNYYRYSEYGIKVTPEESGNATITEGTLTWEITDENGATTTKAEVIKETEQLDGSIVGTFVAKEVGNYIITPKIIGNVDNENIEGNSVTINVEENMTANGATLLRIVSENNGTVTTEPIPEEGISVFVDSNQKIDVQFKHIYNSEVFTDLYIAANRITVEPETSDKIDVQLQKGDGTEATDDEVVRKINIIGKAETTEDVVVKIKVDAVEVATLKVRVKATNVVLNITEPTDGLVNIYLNRAPEGNDMIVNPVNTREIYTLLETEVLKDGESILTLGDITSGKIKVTITGRFGVQINSDWIKLQGIVSGDGKKYIPPEASTKVEYLGIGLDDTKINTTEAIDLVNRLGEEGGKILISYVDAEDSYEFSTKIIVAPAIKTELDEIEADMLSKGIDDLDDFTEETSVRFREARRYASMTLLQVNYDKVVQELTEAYNNLLLAEVIKTELETAQNAITNKTILEGDYTSESWAKLKTAMEKAEAADRISKYNAIKADLDLTKLIPIYFETPELDAANTAKETLQEADYTAESWKKFTDAITAATAATLKSQYQSVVEEGYLDPTKLIEKVNPISVINTTKPVAEDVENNYYRYNTYRIGVASGEKEEKIETGTITKWEILKKLGEEYVALDETAPEAIVEETVVEETVVGNFTANVAGEYKVTPVIEKPATEGETEGSKIEGTPVEFKVIENQIINKVVIKDLEGNEVSLEEAITVYKEVGLTLKIEYYHNYNKEGVEDAKLDAQASRVSENIGKNGKIEVSLRSAGGTSEATGEELVEEIVITGKEVMAENEEIDLIITIDEGIEGKEKLVSIKVKVNEQTKEIKVEKPTENVLNLYTVEQEDNMIVTAENEDGIEYTYSLIKMSLLNNGKDESLKEGDLADITDATNGVGIKIVSTNAETGTGAEELDSRLIWVKGFIDGETPEAKKVIPTNEGSNTQIQYVGISIDELLVEIIEDEEEKAKQLQIIEDIKAGKAKIVISYAGISETVEIGVKLNEATE